jgi:hypothetical protein
MNGPHNLSASFRPATRLKIGFLACLCGVLALQAPAADGVPAPTDSNAASASEAATPSARRAVVVRLYYGDRARLADLVARHDVFEYANHEAGYVLARLWPAEFDALTEAGYRIEIDDALTAQANRTPGRGAVSLAGIAGYPCYRTVEETYAAVDRIAETHPDLATLLAIGSSWDKTHPGGLPGYELRVLVLSNKAGTGPKARFFLMAEHHARELTTAETALRFAEELVTGYGVDPDLTWLLDYSEIHVLPMANPDGRKFAELGQWWRKNTDNTNGCLSYPDYGTDLNRNCGFRWGITGSSDIPCDDVYRGPTEFSEPENQAIRDYIRSMFPDQRGPGDFDAAPATATGLFVSLHSFAELVLYPWGSTATDAPNRAGLSALGAKFGFFNRYTVQSSNQLYPTSGTADEWAYGELGVASYTIEMGTTFFQPCADFEKTIYPSNRLVLRYAAKACRQPYLDPSGPEVLDVTASPNAGLAGSTVVLSAVADDTRKYGTVPALPSHPISAARYSLDVPSWVEGSVTMPLAPKDGTFNAAREPLTATLDTAGWTPGRHTVFVEAANSTGVWGVPTAVFVWVEPIVLSATLNPEGLALTWPSVAGRSYTVLATDSIASPFVPVARNIEAAPPVNRYLDRPTSTGSRFYRVRMDL